MEEFTFYFNSDQIFVWSITCQCFTYPYVVIAFSRWDITSEISVSMSWISAIYLDESKVLQYFGNVRHSLAALNFFCWGSEGDGPHRTVRYPERLILSKCYSPDLLLGIHGFRPTCSWLIVEVLAKFLKPSGYCTVINCTVIFRTIIFFLLLHPYPCSNTQRISSKQRLSNLRRSEAIYNVSAHQLPRNYQLQRVHSIV